ncbi:MAG: hypothetical protein ACRERX_05575 [Pseudomonas sp.]
MSGNLFHSERDHSVVRLTAAVPGFEGVDYLVPSGDGNEIYLFDVRGRYGHEAEPGSRVNPILS